MIVLRNWKVLWAIIIILLISLGYILNQGRLGTIDSFEKCVAAGYPIMESDPRQCAVPGKKTFIEDISDDEGLACTMEAKLCPDGSYVGRTEPNCEFASCPGE